MSGPKPPGPRPALQRKLDDAKTDEVARDHAQQIDALRNAPAGQMRVIAGIVLADGIEQPVAHGLGRPAQWVCASCPRPVSLAAADTITGDGRIEESRGSGALDRARYVVLKATGWGVDIVVDVVVV